MCARNDKMMGLGLMMALLGCQPLALAAERKAMAKGDVTISASSEAAVDCNENCPNGNTGKKICYEVTLVEGATNGPAKDFHIQVNDAFADNYKCAEVHYWDGEEWVEEPGWSFAYANQKEGEKRRHYISWYKADGASFKKGETWKFCFVYCGPTSNLDNSIEWILTDDGTNLPTVPDADGNRSDVPNKGTKDDPGWSGTKTTTGDENNAGFVLVACIMPDGICEDDMAYFECLESDGEPQGDGSICGEQICTADLDGNGVVGAADLAITLGSWGPCEQCAADFDGNGVVNAGDLAVVLGSWGECPQSAVCGDGIVDEGEECDPPNGESCDESCLLIDPPPCSCGCDLNCDGITTDEELLECEDLCGTDGICGDGVVGEGEQCDPPDGVTCDDNCQIMNGACDYPDIRTIVADAEFDPPDIQQNYDAINATLHLFGGMTFGSFFFEPLDLLSAVALERVETLETCAGVPIDAAMVAAALEQMMAVGKGLPLVEVISSVPGELEEAKAAIDQLRMQGIGFPPVATTDSDADLMLNSIMVLVDEAGILEYGDFFFKDSSEISEAQLAAITQANDDGGVLDFQVIDAENGELKNIVDNDRCCNKGSCEPGVLDMDRCNVLDDEWCSVPGSTDNCGLCSRGSKTCP